MADETPQIKTGGEAVVNALIENGVDTVFGIPGIQLDPLYDAFYHKRNQVRMIQTRHEGGAAFMAGPVSISSFQLYRSDLGRGGPTYSELASYDLT